MHLDATPLSTRAKRALAEEGIETVGELREYFRAHGDKHVRLLMFGVGPVTAEELLGFLGGNDKDANKDTTSNE